MALLLSCAHASELAYEIGDLLIGQGERRHDQLPENRLHQECPDA